MAVNPRYLSESFDETAASENILQARHVFEKGNPLYALVHVSNTFTGSVQLECSPPDAANWVACATAITAAGAVSVLIPADADYRFNVTMESGDIDCFMALPA